ncbi:MULTISPECIES: hypothetical protein [Microbacterium]|uniref:hypothetical protein n=1 Tax=Microbacterium TaxID=33882 RepID=UPI0027896FE8|nr:MULTISPECIES: hypothetical protein [Microbacterium]MDQ1084185.1 hypothetical protein [Microbacterium sp. SORGH_AS_0344]MDQ1170540.1 hypothetical protein [Microbacterium proteolyticum]
MIPLGKFVREDTGEEDEIIPVPGRPGEVMLRSDFERAMRQEQVRDPYDRHDTAVPEYEALGRAMESTTPPCDGDLRFLGDGITHSDRVELQDTCLTRCAIRSMCRAYAEKARPAGGIWAGMIWALSPPA